VGVTGGGGALDESPPPPQPASVSDKTSARQKAFTTPLAYDFMILLNTFRLEGHH
jgi:hypothetical protein